MARFARGVVWLYPPSWRERYEEEYMALLADSSLSPRLVLNAALGAADAWSHPRGHLLAAPQRLRATVSVVWCAWIAAAAGALLFAQSTEDQPFRAFDATHPLAGSLYTIYVVAAHLSVVAVLVGAVPLTWSLIRRAWRQGARGLLVLVGVPVAAPLMFLVCLVAISRLVPRSATPGVGVGANWFAVLVVLGLAAGVACAVAPTVALRRVEPAPRAVRLAVLAGVPATATMAIAAGASLAYELAVNRADPSFAAAYSQPWVLVGAYLLLMALACATAVISATRGIAALRATR